MLKLKKAGKAAAKLALAFLVSPQARRYEIALAIGVFEAIRAGITGHA